MTVESRRAAAARIFGDRERVGRSVDPDPVFRGLVEEWVDGTIDVEEVRRRYRDHRAVVIEGRRADRARRIAAMAAGSVAANDDAPAFDDDRAVGTGPAEVAEPIEAPVAQPTLQDILDELGWEAGEAREDDFE